MNFKKELSDEKIKMNWNKNPILMETFLRFLTIDIEKSKNHFGSERGWTLYFNEYHKLEIAGGIVEGIEYLDNIKYGEKLANRYNNFVNPFYLFEIINNEGQEFFLDYYKDEINAILLKKQNDIDLKLNQIKELESGIMEIKNFLNRYSESSGGLLGKGFR
jgi:hypothetical protein